MTLNTEESIRRFGKEQMELLNNYMLNGGDVTLKALRKLKIESPETLNGIIGYLKEAPLYETVHAGEKDFLLCHSGLDNFSPERNLADYTADEFIWAWPELPTVILMIVLRFSAIHRQKVTVKNTMAKSLKPILG